MKTLLCMLFGHNYDWYSMYNKRYKKNDGEIGVDSTTYCKRCGHKHIIRSGISESALSNLIIGD